MELHIHSPAFDEEHAVYSKGIGPSDDSDSDYASRVSSIKSSRYDGSKLEADLYYFGIRGLRHWGPKLIFRTSKDDVGFSIKNRVFRAPWGPEQDSHVMRLQPVFEHDKLGKDDLWVTIRYRVRDVLEVQ